MRKQNGLLKNLLLILVRLNYRAKVALPHKEVDMTLAYQGYGSAKITKVLREEKVPTASWLNLKISSRYGTFAEGAYL